VICQEEHVIPKNGFVVNDRLQELLDVELNKLAPSPMFEECMKEIEDAKENVVKIGLLEKNAENYIYEYFEDIKRQVDIRREDLKIKIDKYSEEIIKSVELNQKNYIKLSIEVNKITENIEKSKKDLNELISRFDTLEFNDEKFKVIKASVAAVNQEFHKILAEYQDSLISNKKYTFEFKELPIEDIFGRVIDFQVNF
jgi:DNA repair ATPase RecN